MEELTPIHFPEHSNRSNTIENQDIPPDPFQHPAESLVEQPFPTTMADVRNPDIIRLENIFRAANSTLSIEAFAENQTLQKYIKWGSLLVGSLNYEAIVQHVKAVISFFAYCSPRADTDEQTRDTAISLEIYRLLLKTKHDMGINILTKITTEAFTLLEISWYFATETSCRLPILPSRCETCRTRILEDIKLDFACANSGLTRQGLLILRETNQREYVRTYHLEYLSLTNNV